MPEQILDRINKKIMMEPQETVESLAKEPVKDDEVLALPGADKMAPSSFSEERKLKPHSASITSMLLLEN